MTPFGRSYDGQNWEGVAPFNSHFDCEGGSCAVSIPAPASGESYSLFRLNHALTQREEVARFLIQTTFGPTLDDVNDAQGLTAEEFIQEQMSTEPTFHRKFYRERAKSEYVPWMSPMGVPRNPCKAGARFVRQIAKEVDFRKQLRFVPVSLANGTDVRRLTIDGTTRAVFSADAFGSFTDNAYNNICFAENRLEGRLAVRNSNFQCEQIRNQNVQLAAQIPDYTIELKDLTPEQESLFSPSDSYYGGIRYIRAVAPDFEAIYLTADLDHPDCPSFVDNDEVIPRTFVRVNVDGSTYLYRHERNLYFDENTLESPLLDGGAGIVANGREDTLCSSVSRTFKNEASCRVSNEPSVCRSDSLSTQQATAQLTVDFLRDLHGALSDTYVYIVTGLAPTEVPCQAGQTIRLARRDDLNEAQCSNSLSGDVRSFFVSKIDDSLPHLVDFLVRDFEVSNVDCADTTPMSFYVWQGSACYQHVHPDERSVLDFTFWASGDPSAHPGGADKIRNWAEADDFELVYPHNDISERWSLHVHLFPKVGKEGDVITFGDFPSSLRSHAGFSSFMREADGFRSGQLVCGSPNEVASSVLGTRQEFYDYSVRLDVFNADSRDFDYFTDLVMYQEDQLRQRVAWALHQILVVSTSGVGGALGTEALANYHDIFVEHAFGNYRDILKEVSRSPVMGRMLSLTDSRSRQFVMELNGQSVYPDENFAREILQLFSVGLVRLNMDGTTYINNEGKSEEVYTNEDILDGARVWTAWKEQIPRANLWAFFSNFIDPMHVGNPTERDQFPKMDLVGGYLGDTYPLCGDLPEKAFLKKGAKYRIMTDYFAEMHDWTSSWVGASSKLELACDSPLRTKLCGSSASCSNDTCSPSSGVIELDENLECMTSECAVDTVQIVRVSEGLYFEYVQMPCVRRAFIEESSSRTIQDPNNEVSLCGHVNEKDAWGACCSSSGSDEATATCEYFGERLSFSELSSRCTSVPGHGMCFSVAQVSDSAGCAFDQKSYWTTQSCSILAKIDVESGLVVVVHRPEGVDSSSEERVLRRLRSESDNFFRVAWENDQFPSSCAAPCEILASSGECLCPVEVVEEPVFSGRPSAADQVSIESLHIGSAPIDSFPANTFEPEVVLSSTVSMFQRTGRSIGDVETVFRVVDKTRVLYLKNLRSSVRVVVNSQTFTFRNPVHFVGFTFVDRRDALYETESAIDNSFYHDNAPPFVCYRMIQRFGISNPSPRYVKECSSAFATGRYVSSSGRPYGVSKWGDMAATVAAILLDREMRSTTLEADPSWGASREPYLQIVHLFRSFHQEPFGRSPGVQLRSNGQVQFGQMPYRSDSVFSFFLPEFVPSSSVVGFARLKSPEVMVQNPPSKLAMLSGLTTHIKFGLTSCFGGLGRFGEACSQIESNGYSAAAALHHMGLLNLGDANLPSSATEMANTVNLLLFNGRLNSRSLQYFIDTIHSETGGGGVAKSAMLQSAMSTPEWNVNNVIKTKDQTRPDAVPTETPRDARGYRATIMIYLDGGADTFNVLVPNTGTHRSKYDRVRGTIALPQSSMLPLTGTDFAVHSSLPVFKDMFDDDELAFFTNLGVLGGPDVNRGNYNDFHPTQLFAHNTQTQEVKSVDLFDVSAEGTGVLGRMASQLSASKDFFTGTATLDSDTALIGDEEIGLLVDYFLPSGTGKFDSVHPTTNRLKDYIRALNSETELMSSLFGESHSDSLIRALNKNDAEVSILSNTNYTITYSNDNDDEFVGGRLPLRDKLKIVGALMKARQERGKERDLFHVQLGGFDTHGSVNSYLPDLLWAIQNSVAPFRDHMKSVGLWDSVTVVIASEFGRTLTPNSGRGSDHGWGGNYAVFGGVCQRRANCWPVP